MRKLRVSWLFNQQSRKTIIIKVSQSFIQRSIVMSLFRKIIPPFIQIMVLQLLATFTNNSYASFFYFHKRYFPDKFSSAWTHNQLCFSWIPIGDKHRRNNG
ncbi:MAG: hypothetical protein QW393_02330 [Candidatus Micrarchaeaceae archaeon]